MRRLEGKVALITGTGGGQGRAAAELFSREGAMVIGCDLKVNGNLETRRSVEESGGRMLALQPVDLSDPSQVDEVVASAVAEFGGLDILYNNASAQRFAPITQMTLDDWTFTMKNDLDLVFLVTRQTWPHLVARGGGSIINTSSTAALAASRGLPTVAHATAKGGVLAMTRALAAEGAPHKIRVNSISPGVIDSPAIEANLTPEFVSAVESQIPLGRIGSCDDIAYCALYLASDESGYVTAQNFTVDGGSTVIS